MAKASPQAELIAAPPEGACACNECPYMRLNTLEKLYLCLRDMKPEIQLDPGLMEQARLPLERMLAL
jgi:quinolinate synthase